MSATVKATEPLDRLQAELNAVLFHVGKVFKTAHSGDSKALHQAKTKAQTGIPHAQAQFGDALDELEKDLTDARSVLNRDLAALRAKRAEREKAAGAARLQNGRLKSGKADASANIKSAQASGQKAAQTPNLQTTVEVANTSRIPPADSTAPDVPSLDPDIESMFTDDLVELAGLGAGGAVQPGPQPLAANSDAALNTDALFTDAGLNIDATDFHALAGGGDQNDIHTILPGLEKYMSQPQDSAAGANGQYNAAADDFDLEALLNDMTGGADSGQSHENSAAAKTDKSNEDSTKNGFHSLSPNTVAPATTGDTQASGSNGIGLGDSGAIDFSNENTFDNNFDELTAGAGDNSTMTGTDDLTNWFDFD